MNVQVFGTLGIEEVASGARVRGQVNVILAEDRMTTSNDATTDSLVALIPTVLATARFLVVGESEALDLTQRTLELALRHRHELRDGTKLRAWVLTIEAREAVRVRRRLSRLLSLDHVVGEIGASTLPDDAALDLHGALARLPARMRAAVVLHHMAGLSVLQTAQAMRVSQNTVKSELIAGLRRLREELNDSRN